MADGNPLVAKAQGNQYGLGAGINIAESATDTFNGIKDGDWVSGGLGMLSLAGDIASAAVDPFGTLMSSVASFLMEHIQPLKDMLDSIAGNPPVIQSYADTWGNISKALGERKTDFDNAVKTGTTGWTGAAADAYRKSAAEHSDALSGAATVAGAISTAVMIMGQVVAFVRQTVRQLIADLVAKLIEWVMEEAFSLGFGTPVVVAQASAAIAKWGKKIGDLLKKLTDTIRKVSPLLSKLVDIFEKIAKVFGKILGKVSGLDGIKIKEGGFVHRIPKGEHGGGVHARSSSEGEHGSDGGSHTDGDSGDSHHDSEPGSRTDSGDTPSADPTSTDGSRRTSGRDDAGGDRAPSSRTDEADGGPAHADDDTSAPSRSDDSPAPSRSDDSPTPTRSGDEPSDIRDSGSPSHRDESAPRRTDDGGDAPSYRSDDGDVPRHSGEDTPTRSADSESPRSPDTHGGDSAPPPRSDAGAPAHSADGGPSPRSAEPDAPAPARSDAPSTHPGGETPSSAPGATSASGTASTAPRTGDPVAPGVPSPRDGAPQTGIPSQGGAPMMGGGPMPPGGAHGGGGGLGGGPSGARPGGAGGWTGTPGSAGGRVPHGDPGLRPGGERPRTPSGEPAPAARGGYGPQGGVVPPVTRGPGLRPGGEGPGGRGPGRPGGPGHGEPGGPGRGGGPGGPPHEGAHPRDHEGSPGNEPEGGNGPYQDPLPPGEVNARYAEHTPSGTSYHHGDPNMGDLPHRVQPDPDGRYTVDVHVTPDGYARIGDRLYTPEEFADILRHNGDYDGRPIRLIGCDAGSNDFARRLSHELDTDVMAPSKPAWTDSHGRVYSSDYEIGPDGRMRPRIPPDGEWHTHHPDGTTHRASEDGFTPDTHESHKHDLDADDAKDRGNSRYIPDEPVPIEERHPPASMKDKINDEEYRRKYYDGPDKNGNYSRKIATQTDFNDEPLKKIREDSSKPEGERFEPKSDDYEEAKYHNPNEPDQPASEQQRKDAQDLVDKRAAANERARNAEADYQDAKTHGTVSEEIERERSDAHRERTDYGEELGEHAARDAIADKYPPKDWEVTELPDPERHGAHLAEGEKPGSGRFDQIYEVTNRETGDTHIVVVEAKGPNAGLGVREGFDGRKYEQGHPEYVNSIIENMKNRGTEAEQNLADDLERAMSRGNLEYYVAKARVRDEDLLDDAGHAIPDPDNPGKNKKHQVYGGYNMKQFDLSPR